MNEKEEEKNIHQLHINIPISLHNEAKELFPNRGELTALIKIFLHRFLAAYKSSVNVDNPFDKALNDVLEDKVKSGGLGIKEENDGTK